MRAVRTARPDESYVVGEMRAVKRIVKEESRRDTDACMLDSSAHRSIRGYGDVDIPMRQVESLQWEPASDNHKYQHDGRDHAPRCNHPTESRLARRAPSPTRRMESRSQAVGDGVVHDEALAAVAEPDPSCELRCDHGPPEYHRQHGDPERPLEGSRKSNGASQEGQRENRRSYTKDIGKFGCGVTR